MGVNYGRLFVSIKKCYLSPKFVPLAQKIDSMYLFSTQSSMVEKTTSIINNRSLLLIHPPSCALL